MILTMEESVKPTKGHNWYPPVVLVLTVNIMVMIVTYSTCQQCVFGMYMLSVECIRTMKYCSNDQVGPIGHGYIVVDQILAYS